jgi:Ca2+/Na+ antiporter
MNALFLGWSVIYSGSLSGLFGPMIFAWLHYFLGSLITSLPELTVTVHNLEKMRAPDLNTALGSVSYSNMVNLAIALLGLILWVVFTSLGVSFSWT